MAKKRKLKKKTFIFVFLFVLIAILIIFLFNGKDKSKKDKLINLGYNTNEVNIILDKVPKDSYDLILKEYNKSLIDIINSKGYKEDNFRSYLEYFEKNKKANIDDIIVIVNSGYDLKDYPASSLLASLVKEKYYLNKNVARYLDYGNNHKDDVKRIVSIVNSNADLDFYSEVKNSKLSDGNLILVNKFFHLDDTYVPEDLVTLSTKYNNGANNQMRKEAADAFMKMVDGALLDNIILKNASAYRSYDYQVNLYDNYVARDGKKNADIYSARPGYSEHQTGLCSDINTVDSSFDGTNEANWLLKNAYKYGFILRFPKGKEDITGYKYEPWHYRYVGKKAAKVIYENDLTLEEYYAYYVEK